MKLDKDLRELIKGVTSPYVSQRDPSFGSAQITNIQSIRNLEKTIKKLDKQNSVLSVRMYFLAVISGLLVFIQLVEYAIKIFNFFK